MSNQFKSGFVALCGQANAGKSTLLNTLLEQKVSIVSPKPQTTRNRIIGVKNRNDAQIAFVDTPGGLAQRIPKSELGRFLKAQTAEAVADVDLCVLVVDAAALAHNDENLTELVGLLGEMKIKQVDLVALNKVDKLAKPRLLPLIAKFQQQSFVDQRSAIVPISAVTGDGVDVLELEIVKRLPDGEPLFPAEQYTLQTERFFVAEIVRERLFFHLEKELPYSVAVRVESWTEREDLLSCGIVVSVERQSQKGIVIGKNGELLKKVGSEARAQLEQVLGIKVFLKIFVRVEPNWTQSTRGLSAAGVFSISE